MPTSTGIHKMIAVVGLFCTAVSKGASALARFAYKAVEPALCMLGRGNRWNEMDWLVRPVADVDLKLDALLDLWLRGCNRLPPRDLQKGAVRKTEVQVLLRGVDAGEHEEGHLVPWDEDVQAGVGAHRDRPRLEYVSVTPRRVKSRWAYLAEVVAEEYVDVRAVAATPRIRAVD